MSLMVLGEAQAKDGKVTVQGLEGFEFPYDGDDFKPEQKSIEVFGFEKGETPEVWEVTDYFEPEIWQKLED